MIESIPGRELTERMRKWFDDLDKHAKSFPGEAHFLISIVKKHCSAMGTRTLSEEVETGEFNKT